MPTAHAYKLERPVCCVHVLNGCPVVLQQGQYTYRHDDVLSCLMTELQACLGNVEIFANLEGNRASDSPLATIPSAILVCPFHPDIYLLIKSLGIKCIQLCKIYSYKTCYKVMSRCTEEILAS